MSDIFPQDAEAAVLTLILRNPDSIYNLDGLKPYMMSSNINSYLLTTMINIGEINSLPDVNLVLNFVSHHGKLEAIGGKEYLNYLYSNDKLSIDNLPEYIRIVKNSYKTRSFLSSIQDIGLEKIQQKGIDNVLSEMKETLDKLSADAGDGHTVSIGSFITDVYKEIEGRTINPGIRGISTGYKRIDLVTGGYSPGDFWVIGGRPGQGKSSFVINTINFCSKNNIPTILFSKEMNRNSIGERLLALETGIGLSDIRLGRLTDAEKKVLKNKSEEILNFPIYIDSNFSADIYYIESVIRKFANFYGTKVIFIDYLQLLSERDENQTAELGRISKKLKLLSEQLGICTIALSQLNREVEHRESKRPMLSDLRQCGNIEEDADIVIGLYRDEYYNKETRAKGILEFNILKHRNGPIGLITLAFSEAIVSITNE